MTSALISKLDEIERDFHRPLLRVLTGAPYEPRKWRERHNAYLRSQRTARCSMCRGTGEIKIVGDFGEYEQSEPCPKCATPGVVARRADEVPF